MGERVENYSGGEAHAAASRALTPHFKTVNHGTTEAPEVSEQFALGKDVMSLYDSDAKFEKPKPKMPVIVLAEGDVTKCFQEVWLPRRSFSCLVLVVKLKEGCVFLPVVVQQMNRKSSVHDQIDESRSNGSLFPHWCSSSLYRIQLFLISHVVHLSS